MYFLPPFLSCQATFCVRLQCVPGAETNTAVGDRVVWLCRSLRLCWVG